MTREIETHHLILHTWRATDFHEEARMLADPNVMRYITHEYGPLSYEEAKQAHARILRLWDDRGFGPWAAVEKASGRRVWADLLANPLSSIVPLDRMPDLTAKGSIRRREQGERVTQ